MAREVAFSPKEKKVRLSTPTPTTQENPTQIRNDPKF